MEKHQYTEDGFSVFEPLENQGSQEPKIDLADKHRELAFEPVNEVTWKLTDGVGTIAWDGYRGYRTTRAIAWLLGIGNGLWVVRYRNKASKLMKLNAAKAYAIEMVKGIRPGVPVADHVGRLNSMAAAVVGANAQWLPPIELSLVEYIRRIETPCNDVNKGEKGAA